MHQHSTATHDIEHDSVIPSPSVCLSCPSVCLYFCLSVCPSVFVACWTLPSPMTSIVLQGHFSCFGLKISHFTVYERKCRRSNDGWHCDDLDWPFKVTSDGINGFVVCISYVMYEFNYNGKASWMNNYFYCCIRPQGLFYDAERDLFAKFS